MTMDMDLGGKTALVTGASSGLGAHFATILARAGATVIVCARRTAALSALVEQIAAAGGARARAVSLDVASAQSIKALTKELSMVDILVNNAGITCDAFLMDMAEEEWASVFDTNLKGMFLMTQAVARCMISRQSGGSIINIASILGIRQAGMVSAYAASKAAAIQLTKTSALELARHKIRVNAIAPGYIGTDLNAEFFGSEAGRALIKRIPQRRLGTLAELDGPLLLLASDASSYMTGSVIAVDGGHLVSSL